MSALLRIIYPFARLHDDGSQCADNRKQNKADRAGVSERGDAVVVYVHHIEKQAVARTGAADQCDDLRVRLHNTDDTHNYVIQNHGAADGNGDAQKLPDFARAVEPGTLVQFRRYVFQLCEPQNHTPADREHVHENEGRHTRVLRLKPLPIAQPYRFEKFIDDTPVRIRYPVPQKTAADGRNQHGEIVQYAVKPHTRQFPVEQEGQQKGKHQRKRNVGDRIQKGDAQRSEKPRSIIIVGKILIVVFQPHKGSPLGEGERAQRRFEKTVDESVENGSERKEENAENNGGDV